MRAPKAARIVVLGVAVGAGGLAAMLAGRSDPPPPPVVQQVVTQQIDAADILVAKADVGIGRALTAGDVEWQQWPTKSMAPQFIRKSDNPNAITTVTGSIVRTPFQAGEPIRENKLIRANGSGYMAAILPAGMRAVATEITPEAGAGGFILPNDRVDVILTSAERSGVKEFYQSRTILKNVRVLAVDQNVEEKNGQKVVIGKIATLELKPEDAEKLSLSRRLGSISLVLRSISDQTSGADDGVTDRPNDVEVIRFGRLSQ